MVSEIEPYVCTEYTSPRAESDSRIFAAIEQRTIIGPVIQIPSTISQKTS